MILDITAFSILFGLDDQVSIDSYNSYRLSCIQACAEAIIIYKLQNELSEDFKKYSKEFNDSVLNSDNTQLDFDQISFIIENLKKDESFNTLYKDYLNKINRELISQARTIDENNVDEFEDFLEEGATTILRDYIKLFIIPDIIDYQSAEIEKDAILQQADLG